MKNFLTLLALALVASSCSLNMPKRNLKTQIKTKRQLSVVEQRRLDQIRCVERFVRLEVNSGNANQICNDIFKKGE
jgi:hypothetical protein